MNATKADMKDLYFKHQDVFHFDKYVNRFKKLYNNLEDLRHTEFELQKVQTLLGHINCPDDKVKECVHTTRKDHKYKFQGLVHIWQEKLHTSSLRRIHNRSSPRSMDISREGGTERGASMHLGWTIAIRRLKTSRKIMAWTFMTFQGTTILENGTNCPSRLGKHYLSIKKGFQRKIR